MRIDPERDLLLAVDVQPDFMPGGALAVAGGDAVVAPINRLLAGPFRHAVATQDWHPPGHASFASSHPGHAAFETVVLGGLAQTLWPTHCVQNTPGAALHPALEQGRIELVLRKGFRPNLDSYSAFRENDRRTTTGLAGWLRVRGITRIFLAGLATDYCVAWSAEDALQAGFAAVVIEDACRGIDLPTADGLGTVAAARAGLMARGAAFVTSNDLG